MTESDAVEALLKEFDSLPKEKLRIKEFQGIGGPLAGKQASKSSFLYLYGKPSFKILLGITTNLLSEFGTYVMSGEPADGNSVQIHLLSAEDDKLIANFVVESADGPALATQLEQRSLLGCAIARERPQSENHRAFLIASKAKYIGGLEGESRCSGSLLGSEEYFGIGSIREPKKALVRWDECEWIEVDGGEVTKSKAAATVAFGVLGALASKGSKSQAVLAAKLKNGRSAYFELDDITPQAVKANLSGLMSRAGVSLKGESPAAPSGDNASTPPSLKERLLELTELRDEGLLTDEEFAEQKARLLSS
jgi:hypothetical protein